VDESYTKRRDAYRRMLLYTSQSVSVYK